MNGLLPVGSVVQIKGAEKKAIIMGYLPFDEENHDKVYDYMGVPFPVGYMGKGSAFLFDNDAVEEVTFRGYEDPYSSSIMTAVSAAFEQAGKIVNDSREDS